METPYPNTVKNRWGGKHLEAELNVGFIGHLMVLLLMLT
jgi:hypothetical protein